MKFQNSSFAVFDGERQALRSRNMTLNDRCFAKTNITFGAFWNLFKEMSAWIKTINNPSSYRLAEWPTIFQEDIYMYDAWLGTLHIVLSSDDLVVWHIVGICVSCWLHEMHFIKRYHQHQTNFLKRSCEPWDLLPWENADPFVVVSLFSSFDCRLPNHSPFLIVKFYTNENCKRYLLWFHPFPKI